MISRTQPKKVSCASVNALTLVTGRGCPSPAKDQWGAGSSSAVQSAGNARRGHRDRRPPTQSEGTDQWGEQGRGEGDPQGRPVAVEQGGR
ncbi:hypothetical protein ACWDE9_12980 [Streptomyces olivaceoviridis]